MKTYNEKSESEIVGNRTFMIVQRENKKQFEKKQRKLVGKKEKNFVERKNFTRERESKVVRREGHHLQEKKYVLKREK